MILLTCLCAAPASAQQSQGDGNKGFEVFVGYSAQSFETEEFNELDRFAGIPASQITSNFNLTAAQAEDGFRDAFKTGRNQQGFNASGTFYFNKYFGITGDFTYTRSNSTRSIANNPLFFEDTSHGERSTYNFLFGPQVKFRKSRLEPFVHALIGVVRQRNNVTLSIHPGANPDDEIQTLRLRDNYNAFNAAFGGGLDIRVSRHIAIRAIQVDYLPVFTRSRDALLTAPTAAGADGSSLGQTTFDSSRRDGLRISVGVVFR